MTGIELISKERAKHFSEFHSVPDAMISAAQAYLLSAEGYPSYAKEKYPYKKGFSPSTKVNDLIKAGAFIAALIDQINGSKTE